MFHLVVTHTLNSGSQPLRLRVIGKERTCWMNGWIGYNQNNTSRSGFVSPTVEGYLY